MADKLAKRGAAMTQHDNPITLTEKKTIIKHSFRAKKIPDNYHKLDRAEQVIILRLRTGHNRLNSHMYKTMKLVQSPLCTCHTGDQTADHILQDCPTFTNLRTQIWPDGISRTTPAAAWNNRRLEENCWLHSANWIICVTKRTRRRRSVAIIIIFIVNNACTYFRLNI